MNDDQRLRIIWLVAKASRGLATEPELVELATVTDVDMGDAERIKSNRETSLDPTDRLFEKCESLPEKVLLAALIHVGDGHVEDNRLIIRFGFEHLTVRPQFPVLPAPHLVSRRIDFAVTAERHRVARIAVEVDGYEFHYSDYAKADATLRRSRELLLAGWSVLPFSATDACADPLGCAHEVINVARRLGGHRG